MSSHFTVIRKDPDTNARLGRLVTAHGAVETPCFMPVGTQGTVKAMLPRDLREMGCQIVLGNTYHLYLRPGHELIRQLGGLHRFMGWDGPILTDSGGLPVFSLGAMRKITEEGVCFQSHWDGATHLLTPDKAIAIQEALDSDIARGLDECLPPAQPRGYDLSSSARTSACALRAHNSLGRALLPCPQRAWPADVRHHSRRVVPRLTPMVRRRNDANGFRRLCRRRTRGRGRGAKAHAL